jgi:hypothetical protein
MKTGKYIPLGTYNDVKIGYGTVDFKNLKTIYLKLNSWVQPENETDDFDHMIHKTRRKVKEILYNLKNPYFKQQSIVDLDIRTKGIKLEKRSFMNLEITLYVDRQFDVKSKNNRVIDVFIVIKSINEDIRTQRNWNRNFNRIRRRTRISRRK